MLDDMRCRDCQHFMPYHIWVSDADQRGGCGIRFKKGRAYIGVKPDSPCDMKSYFNTYRGNGIWVQRV